MTRSFKDLIVWQKAHSFVVLVYQATKRYPKFELFGLCSQFQRAVVSIPANIAEGYRRDGKADKLRFLNFAQGSLEECRYYILLSKDLCYIDIETYDLLTTSIEETSKLLNVYYKGVKEHMP